jgi:hypothetical protein
MRKRAAEAGISPQEFGEMTPGEFLLMWKGFLRRQEMEDWRTAMVVSTLCEINRDRKKRPKPYTPEDFMPQKKQQKKQKEPAKPRSTQRMRETVEYLNKAFGGRDLRGVNK